MHAVVFNELCIPENLLPEDCNLGPIPCEITQKSAILTPTPFDFGENW